MAPRRAKFLNTTDSEQLYDDVEEKKAIPELILKADILKAEEAVLLLERRLMNVYRRYRTYSAADKADLEGAMVLLFSYVKDMIEEKGILKDERDLWDDMLSLERGASFKLSRLLSLKNYLLKNLHRLGITNLLLNRGKSFEQQLNDEY